MINILLLIHHKFLVITLFAFKCYHCCYSYSYSFYFFLLITVTRRLAKNDKAHLSVPTYYVQIQKKKRRTSPRTLTRISPPPTYFTIAVYSFPSPSLKAPHIYTYLTQYYLHEYSVHMLTSVSLPNNPVLT